MRNVLEKALAAHIPNYKVDPYTLLTAQSESYGHYSPAIRPNFFSEVASRK
jgi:hypothetical protein